MSTIGNFENATSFATINKTPLRTTVESAFYGNNVKPVKDLKEAYKLAKASPGTVELTGMPIYKPQSLGLPSSSNVLLFNDGAVFGRCAAARRILGQAGINTAELCTVIREAMHNARNRTFYTADAVVGLEEDFMVKAHIMLPEGYENNLLSWMLNFQNSTSEYERRYKKSRKYENDGDIFVYADPYWSHPDFPLGLACFSPEENVAAVLGMRYFGELKKGTLTLAWGIAARNGYASCHGGLKRYKTKDGQKFVLAVFGLSGSGKSTITHAKHDGKYEIKVLHDDAFVINVQDKYSIALEPAYFDKMQDYPIGCPDNKYLLTLQNCGVTKDENGRLVCVSEDRRNGNGRAVKSRLWTPNRVDRIDEPLNAIAWLMKDPTLPPVVKITGPSLASVMGSTLATKRTTAERLAPGVDPNALVIESYANPFRTYPLGMDYSRFKQLFEDGVDCYIINTGFFGEKKIPKEVTLEILEKIVEKNGEWKPFGNLPNISYLPIEGFEPNFNDKTYTEQLKARMQDRITFVETRKTEKNGADILPEDALTALKQIISAM